MRPEQNVPSALQSPLPADEVAEREWPALRARFLDAAAALDRMDRAGAADSPQRRLADQVLAELSTPGEADRAERILRLLSRGYDPTWQTRFAAGEVLADPGTESPDS